MTDIKPFTNYVCSVGPHAYGHKSLWTGAYQRPEASDGSCVCGAPMVEEVDDGTRWRVEFESIDPHHAAEYEALRGSGVWRSLTDDEWDRLSWHPVSREDASESSIRAQYEALSAWAESREQPIRNVRMSRHVGQWEPVT